MSEARHGQVIGYMVACWDPPGKWMDDWDGEIHPTLPEGQAALRECSAAGFDCILTKLVRVNGSRRFP